MIVRNKQAAPGKKPAPKKTPAKTATKRKRTTRRPKRKSTRSKKGKVGLGKRLFSIGWKLALVGAVAMGAVLYYLNQVVKERFEGELFELPTVVYARVLNLSVGDAITPAQLRNELDVLSYRKVSTPRHPGEYSSSSTKIELIRRPFEFADGPEPDRHVMLYFNDGTLSRIQSLEQKGDLAFYELSQKCWACLRNKRMNSVCS